MTVRYPTLPSTHPANRVKESELVDPSKFAPKMTFVERCGMAAAKLRGYNNRQISVAFNIHRRTVGRVLAEGVAYKSIRDEIARYGQEDFIGKYFTEEVYARMKFAASDPELDETDGERDAATNASRTGSPNPRADGQRGIALYKGPHHVFTHRIDVVWEEQPQGTGWYNKFLDIKGSEDYCTGDDDGMPFLTSNAALRYGKRWLDENQ